MKYRALLIKYRALWSKYWTFLIHEKALMIEWGLLLMEYKGSFDQM